MKAPQELQHPQLMLWFLMTELSRTLRQRVDQQMRALDLTKAQWYALCHLYFLDGITQQDLSDMMDLDKSSTAKLLRKLEEKGWIERSKDEIDRRSIRINLKKDVRNTVGHLTKLAGDSAETALSGLKPADCRELIAMLQRMEKALGSAPPPDKAAAQSIKRHLQPGKKILSTKI